MKGEMMNPHSMHQPIKRDTSRPKLTTPINPGIHFAPNLDPSFSFNYTTNPSKIFAPSPQPGQQQQQQGQQQMVQPLMAAGQPYDFAISPYRMLNFEMKGGQPQFGQSQNSLNANEMMAMQQQQQPGTGIKQSQQEQSYQRPVSSTWNMAGGAGNTGSLSHKFMSEYSDDLKNYGNFFGAGGAGGGGSGSGGSGGFLSRFVNGSGDKQFRSGAKYGFFIGMFLFTIALIGGAVFLGIFLSSSK